MVLGGRWAPANQRLDWLSVVLHSDMGMDMGMGMCMGMCRRGCVVRLRELMAGAVDAKGADFLCKGQ